MTFNNWIVSQSAGVKLAIGFGVGIILWVALRWFIKVANKNYVKNPRKQTWKEKLENIGIKE